MSSPKNQPAVGFDHKPHVEMMVYTPVFLNHSWLKNHPMFHRRYINSNGLFSFHIFFSKSPSLAVASLFQIWNPHDFQLPFVKLGVKHPSLAAK